MPNPALGHGPPPPPGSMPPPSSIPENSLYRQNYAYASAPRTPDRWPLGATDDQRQMQEQYRQQAQTPQHHPNYLPQPSPVSSVTPAGPVSSFPPATQTRSPPQVQPSPQSPRTVGSPPSVTSQSSQQPMTTTTALARAQTNSPLSTPTKEPTNPASSAPVAISLESQRVSALLELNRVLIQEVVALQESHKESKAGTSASASQIQRSPQQTSPPPATEGSTSGTPQSKPDPANSAKEESETNTTTADDTSTSTTTTKPTQPQPPQQNKIPNSKEYIGYMRRLQANLAYLASIADRHNKPGPQFPAIMEAPDTGETGGDDKTGGKEHMKELYAKLRELWPDYVKGKVNTPGGTAVGTATTTSTTTAATTTAISAPATTPTTTAAA
ncbi:MAG: hypothetical protein Q9221_003173 [Calogaya cf. arnoldii]